MIFFPLLLAAVLGSPPSPQVFAPGVISSGAADSAPTFSSDGREIFFERSNGQSDAILTARRTGATWSKPKVAPFSGHWLDLESALSATGGYLVFSSNRPATAGGPPLDGFYNGRRQTAKGGALWRIDRVHGRWGKPYRLPRTVNISSSIYEPSLASNGDLYFQSTDSDGKQFHLYFARATATGYAAAEPIALNGPPDSSDMDPAIAPDGSFLVFSSDRKGGKDHHLFIAFHRDSGWTDPRPLGADVNSGSVGDPRIDLAHHRLYFVSRRLAPATGRSAVDLDNAARWNNGLSNIWFVRFDPAQWRAPDLSSAGH
jgi:hypothetical protein